MKDQSLNTNLAISFHKPTLSGKSYPVSVLVFGGLDATRLRLKHRIPLYIQKLLNKNIKKKLIIKIKHMLLLYVLNLHHSRISS